MRGEDHQQNGMFSYLSPEQRVPRDHPPRKLRPLVDEVLKKLSRRFTAMYAQGGRSSIPAEKLLRALLQVLYTLRSERRLMEQLDYNLLFRWFVGLNMDNAVWDATVYSKNREGLLNGDVAEEFFREVLGIAKQYDLLSDEHFTVDGTLIEAWAGQKSFKKKDREEGSPPHVAQYNTYRRSAVDGRTPRHAGKAISQKKRKRIEEIFGWMKTLALMRKVRHRGRARARPCHGSRLSEGGRSGGALQPPLGGM